ncbi:hypothetical protein [Nocardia acidivorans]|uniref:hypothetical protein n=1 Tax=Nocardia acidivorans TaxID=404580 RepID=UPI00082CF95A|nr:hypothetical protein [Nocardia acidivorans]
MKPASYALLAVTPLLIAGLAACGGSSDSAKSSTTTTAKSATTTATTSGQTALPTARPTLSPNPARPPIPPAPTPADVDCGPITGANGASANVIAYSNQAGVPGCTEAITVAGDYVNATRGGDAVQVDGWTCEPQPDNTVPHICFKDGFLIGLRGTAAPNPPVPPTTTNPPTITAGPVDNADCGTVTDAGGGTRTIIAVGTPAGRVGCTEAIDVATRYVRSVSDTDVATIDGWSCNAQPDAQAPSACAKDGLLINLLAR